MVRHIEDKHPDKHYEDNNWEDMMELVHFEELLEDEADIQIHKVPKMQIKN